MCEIFARQDPGRYQPVTRRIRLNGQSTSVRLEAVFWDILDEIAREQGESTGSFLSTLHREVLEYYGEPLNFASLLRCSCLARMEARLGMAQAPGAALRRIA
ncbi:ribbon-helix-helix domain-containing protein [Pseudogemmobacter faecipullorum]|uniref:Ribbon-helix-helix domain-containing protein n=1 Tax=Pseudogemmobacter faecipullorum TaxID=2755041 RepID=A0ABS8CRH2_9RHOB|nr:ribbon-helix-helix domain-containing protein [Pseudogemmobacter faecipullorum]MCB5411999.1 ribbon-helix-helix domain-containing protein [Pseudogemmobacter faecipullorum]